MKLRYTPLQGRVLSVEEEASPPIIRSWRPPIAWKVFL